MYYGQNFIEESKARCAAMSVQTEQLKQAFEQHQADQQRQFREIMEEGRLRLIERFRSMKAEHPDSPEIQQLCDKQLAQLEAEGTGA